MKISTNKEELQDLDACESGFNVFIDAHGDKEVKFSEALDSNGWDDIWWLISNVYDQLSDKQKDDLRVYGCKKALINIEKIKPYCSSDDYGLIITYLNSPTESARSAARSAADSAAWSARSAASSAAWPAARSAAWSAARSAADSAAWSARSAADSAAWSARSAADSAAMKEFTQELRELFLKWEESYKLLPNNTNHSNG